MKLFYSLILVLISSLFFPFVSNAQIVGTNAYIMGDFVEVGVHARGYEGAPSFAGSHERGGVGLGFVANPAEDGWMQYDGDFFLPGSPENGFGIEVAGVNYSNNRAFDYQIPGAISSYNVIGDCIKVGWSGSAAGVDVDVTYSHINGELYYSTQVILTNTTAATLTDVYYYRNFDPDNNQSIGGSFVTQNTIEAQPSPACEKALVSATQATPHSSYVGIGAIGPDYRVTYGGFSNRDASNIWNGIGFTSAVGASASGDVAISLAHRTYTLAPGASDTIQFTIILNAADIDAAISSLYFFDYAGSSGVIDECNPVVDTAWTCAGQPTTISVAGPGVANFTWNWSPGTALSTTTGATTDASPTTTTLYTVTGTPVAACVATTISKEIVVDIWDAPDISITDPGPQCGDFDLTTLVITDLNATPGVTTEFYSVIPDSATQVAGIWPSSTMTVGDVVYVMMANPVTGCFDVEPVIIDFSGGATAGPDDATTVLCNTPGSTVNCNTLLVGADPGGFWEETTVPASGAFTPGTGVFNASGLAGGVYTVHYVATALPPCTNDTAVMTITVNPTPTAGPDNTTSLCNSLGSSVDLNTLLSGADASGVWTETSGTASGGFTPATGVLNAAGVAAGDYTFNYTVNGLAPCGNDIATMTITIEQEVNAGADNTASICNSPGSTLNLNTLLVGADAGGTWLETSGTASGGFTPGTGVLDASGVTAGSYTFTYTLNGVAPCIDDFATMTITVADDANAGPDNATSLCNTSGTTLNLNTLLVGADPSGAWTETSGTSSGGLTPATGVLDASGVAAGVYTFDYTASAIAPCLTDIATMTITIEQEVVAGPDNTATMCNTLGSTLDLDGLLVGADAGGTWSETTVPASGGLTPATGMFDASGLTAGSYTFNYDLTAVAPCLNDVATMTISVTDLPNAGSDNTASLCNTSGTTLNLSTLLVGADPGGTWAETTGSGAFTPGTSTLDASGLAAGIYTFTYDILAAGPCPGDQSVFDITVEQEVNAGADNTDALCNYAGTTLNLNTLLSGADAGGTWAETSGSGAFTAATGVFDASSLPAGTYSFTYTLTAVAPCLNDVSDFDITVEEAMTAGPDNAYSSCNNAGAIIDVSSLLFGADAGGTWTSTAPGGSLTGTLFDMSGVAGGTYTFDYTVNPLAPCPSDIATMSITVNETPTIDPVSDLQVCSDDNLVVPGFTSDVPGTTFDWTNVTGTDVGFGVSGVGNIGTFSGVNPGTSPITVTVDVTPTSPNMCVGATESFTITVNPIPVVNFSADTLIGCEPLVVSFSNSSTPGGDDCVWTFGDGSSATGCGGVSHTYNNSGSYDVGLTVTTAEGCTNSASFADYINVSLVPEAFFSYSPGVITSESPEVEFTNSSINADYYVWDFGDYTALSSEENPTHLYPNAGAQYTVTLVAESAGGCVDSVSQVIIIQDVLIFYIPNSFTPDGDEFNQTFKPVITSGVDIYDYHLTIFNRWGEILFESYNVDNGWDGTYGSEGLVESEVYIWQIEFGETMSDKNNIYRGHVTILK